MNVLLTSLPLNKGPPSPSPANESAHPQHSSTDVSAAAVMAAAEMQQLIDDLPEEIALLDERANFLAVNTAWRQAVEVHGQSDALPGHNYREVCKTLAAQGYRPAIDAMAGLDGILSGKRDRWQLIYNGGERWRERDYEISFHRIAVGGEQMITVTRHDLTEILQLRRKRMELARTVNEGQAVERQRIGRELHDSTSQLLAAMGLVLGRLRYESPASEATGLVEEMQELLQEVHQEIRSVSYLAHPPSLKRLGLVNALKSLVDGFGRRTGIEASFDIVGEAVPMSASVESAFYRLAQEAFSNVHRHAHATQVRLHISFRKWSTHIVVTDNGVGISHGTLAGVGEGVGLPGMRSRLAEVGGRLTVRALSPGTAIIGSVPIVSQVLPARESPPSWPRPSLADPA
jgi:signal transduction histidine kinase